MLEARGTKININGAEISLTGEDVASAITERTTGCNGNDTNAPLYCPRGQVTPVQVQIGARSQFCRHQLEVFTVKIEDINNDKHRLYPNQRAQ